jgi:ricin-type beta-trefoil lectin protein
MRYCTGAKCRVHRVVLVTSVIVTATLTAYRCWRQVLDVPGGNTAPGTRVQIYPKNTPATLNQLWLWTLEGYIVSGLNPNLVLDVVGGNTTPGTPVQIFPRNTSITANQLWFATQAID